MGAGGEVLAAGLVAKVPAESRSLVRELLDEPLVGAAALQDEVDAYVERFRAAQRGNEFLDIGQAESLAEQCEELLNAVGDDAPEGRRRLVQVAVRYFVIEEDGDSDMGIGGLDDDEAVVAAVEQLLSAPNIDATTD